MPFVLWDEEGDPLLPEELPLSPRLQAELLEWQEFVRDHISHDGWDTPGSEAEFVRRGRGLHKWLERELGEPVDVDLGAARVGW